MKTAWPDIDTLLGWTLVGLLGLLLLTWVS